MEPDVRDEDYTRREKGVLMSLLNLYDEIARVAYELWEKRDREHGRDCDDWYQAEIIVRAGYAQPRTNAQEMETKPAKTKKPASKRKPEKSLTGDTHRATKKT